MQPDCVVECFHVDEGTNLGVGPDRVVIEVKPFTLEAAKRNLSPRYCHWDSSCGIRSDGSHRTPTMPESLWKHIEHPDHSER